MNRKEHWEEVYNTKEDSQVGWFQENPEVSLQMVKKYTESFNDSIIDIGGGNAYLLKNLSTLGYLNLTLIDISKAASERSKKRFENSNSPVSFIEQDILTYHSENPFNIWHDRAVFHFLTDDFEKTKYADIAAKNIKQSGYMIIGTFSTSGPKSCSGLPIVQYSVEKFGEIFNDQFEMIECFDDIHVTPSGNPQNFIWAIFRRK